MNNSDVSNLMRMLNNMDQKQLANGIEQLNKILSNEDKMKLMQALKGKN